MKRGVALLCESVVPVWQAVTAHRGDAVLPVRGMLSPDATQKKQMQDYEAKKAREWVKVSSSVFLNCELVFSYPYVVLNGLSRPGIKKLVNRVLHPGQREALGSHCLFFLWRVGIPCALGSGSAQSRRLRCSALAGGRDSSDSHFRSAPAAPGTVDPAGTAVRYRERRRPPPKGLSGEALWRGEQEEGKERIAPETLSAPGERRQSLWALSFFKI